MIPIYQPYLSDLEKQYVNQCLDTNWISSKGEFIAKFEDKFANYIDIAHSCTVANGTVALHLALMALDLGAGDEIMVPTLTYVASVNTITQVGARPVFIDSLTDSWQIDPADIVKKLSTKTKAIMVVHLYGLMANLEVLRKICDEHNLYLIEDCAQAFGSYYQGLHAGSFGDIATFSFFGNKTISTGEGGMVVSANGVLIDKVRHLKNQGVSLTREYWHDILAYNYRMTNICAAIGLVQLERAAEILAKKRQIARYYQTELSDLPLKLQLETKDARHSYWLCSIRLYDCNERDNLRNYLWEAGIETRPVFYPAHTLPHCQAEGDFPVAMNIASGGINLPSFPALSYTELDMICERIRVFFKGKTRAFKSI